MSYPISPISPTGLRSSSWQDKLQGKHHDSSDLCLSWDWCILFISTSKSTPDSECSSKFKLTLWIDHCRRTQQHPPVFNIVSDRRGGRTAWSSTVTIKGNQVVNARFWYDGQYVNNAKEDAAEVALQQLMGEPASPQQQVWPQGRQGLKVSGI